MVPTPEVIAAAANVYASYRQSELWAPALIGADLTTPDQSVAPLLTGDSEYFIFEIRKHAAVTARMAIDLDGTLLEAEGVKTATGALSPFIDPLTTKWLARDRALRLVWQPCLQSATRLRPFWEIKDSSMTRYLRVDGFVFDKPTFKIGIG